MICIVSIYNEKDDSVETVLSLRIRRSLVLYSHVNNRDHVIFYLMAENVSHFSIHL